MTKDKAHSFQLATIFLAVLIDLMGFGIVLPLLPFYARQFNAHPLQIGLLYSIYSFAQLIFSPLWGNLSDRIGRRPVMLISTFGAILAYSLFSVAWSLPVLFISRLIAGIMGGNISTAQAYIADITTPENRAKGMGLIGAAFGIGFMMGPALSAVLLQEKFLDFFHISAAHKYMVPGIFAACLSLCSFLLVFFKLPETVVRQPAAASARMSIFTRKFWQFVLHPQALHQSIFPWLLFCAFLFSFGQSTLYSSFPLFCEARHHLRPDQVGIIFASMGIVAVSVQGGLIRVLLNYFRESRIFFIGCTLLCLGFALIPLAGGKVMLTLFLCLMTLGAGLTQPTLNSLISQEAGSGQTGMILGIAQGIAALGRTLGPAWGGALFSLHQTLPFFLTAGILLLSVYTAYLVGSIEKRLRT